MSSDIITLNEGVDRMVEKALSTQFGCFTVDGIGS